MPARAWPSVRRPGGECVGAFWPDVVGRPIQGDHFDYFWNGARIRYVRKITGAAAVWEL